LTLRPSSIAAARCVAALPSAISAAHFAPLAGFRRVDPGNPDALTALQTDGIAIVHMGNAPRGVRRGGDQQQREATGDGADRDR